MKRTYLFPSSFKKVGWVVFFPSLALGILSVANEWQPPFFDTSVLAVFIDELLGEFRWIGTIENNVLDELVAITAVISGLMLAFSKEPDEDELISQIRLESLVWATYVNYGVLVFAFILVYDIAFFWVMIANMFTILLFFIIRFNWTVYKLRKSLAHEEQY